MASKWHKNGPSLLLSLLLALTPLLANAQSGELFPRPPELEDAVNFWVRVYTEVDTNSGFLHDSRHLSVIYERLPLDRREIEATRNRIREDLRVLATGKRSGLTASQQEILALWPADVSNETLRTAVNELKSDFKKEHAERVALIIAARDLDGFVLPPTWQERDDLNKPKVQALEGISYETVSYTHLTLPTKA